MYNWLLDIHIKAEMYTISKTLKILHTIMYGVLQMHDRANVRYILFSVPIEEKINIKHLADVKVGGRM